MLVACKKHSHELPGVQGKVHKRLAVEDHSEGGQNAVVLSECEALVEVERGYFQEPRLVNAEQVRVAFRKDVQKAPDNPRDELVDLLEVVGGDVLAQFGGRQAEVGLLLGQQLLDPAQVLGLLPVEGLGPAEQELDFEDKHRVQVFDDFDHLEGLDLEVHFEEDFEVHVGGVEREARLAAVFHQVQEAKRGAPNVEDPVFAEGLLDTLALRKQDTEVVGHDRFDAAKVLEKGFFWKLVVV